MPSSHPLPTSCHWFSRLASALDPRSATWLAWLLVGAALARGRRTVTSWIRAAGLSAEFRPCDTTVSAVGKRTDLMAAHLAHEVVKPLVASASRLTFALDDTPTKRHGRHVQGAGVHHNPTPGPAGVRSCPGPCGSSSGSSPATRRGASSPSRSWPGCTSGIRTLPASPRSTGRRSGPNWNWPSNWCGGRYRGSPTWASPCGRWPTGRTPRPRSSSPCGHSP
jgi:hypothetical protein